MEKFVSIILVLFSLNSFAQLPAFESNVSTEESTNSLVKEHFSSKYEYIISYHGYSYWSEGQTYFIFLYDGQNWELIRWTFKLDEQKLLIKSRRKKLKYSREKFDEILTFMTEENFYKLGQKPLNLNRKDNGDGTEQVSHISDAGMDEFEIISPNSHRISRAYAADILQDEYPTSDRKCFIECRNKLFKLINEKS